MATRTGSPEASSTQPDERSAGLAPLAYVTGDSGTGKTTLIVALVRQMHQRGLTVATIKHASHGYDADRPGKDSWRLFIEAESEATLLIGDQSAVLFRRAKQIDPSMQIDMLRREHDVVLVEGYRSIAQASEADHVHIETLSSEMGVFQVRIRSGQPEITLDPANPEEIKRITDLILVGEE